MPFRLLFRIQVTFKWDLMFTPSKPVNLTAHWKERYLQIGYGGVPMMTPQQVPHLARLGNAFELDLTCIF